MKRDIDINLPPQEVVTDVLLEKYCKHEESTQGEIFVRVARGLSANEPDHWQPIFLKALNAGLILGGRINSACGTEIAATLINCFVQPIGDATTGVDDDGNPGIYAALAQAADTMRRGGGVGYDFSNIRPKGGRVNSTHSESSGPVSYMRVFDRSCETVESAGARRGAQMGILRCDHPDILEFIHAKDQGDLKNFNISVAVTDAFMALVDGNESVELWHKAAPTERVQGAYQRADGNYVYRVIGARQLWDEIMKSTYDHAEPGVVFIDRVNAVNNLWYAERIYACNPCGEQFLPAYGCCDLGSVNLTRFVRDPFTPHAFFDYEAYSEVVKVGIRMLDNVLDVTLWPLEEQRREAAAKRRIGMGFTGLGDALVMLGLRYDSPEGREQARVIAEVQMVSSYAASIELAKERGPFPLFDREKYLQGPFIQRLPEHLRAAIYEHGIRNSHLLSIAPTGTISLAFADNASNGIEPAFSWFYTRKKRMVDGSIREYAVEDHAYRLYKHMFGPDAELTPAFVTALEMKALDHVAMMEVVQPYVDSAISKTVNVPADYPYDDFKGLYTQAYNSGLKGLATYRPNSVLGSVLSVSASTTEKSAVKALDQDDVDRRMRVEASVDVVTKLPYPSRPRFENGNMAWTEMMTGPGLDAGLFVGEDDQGKPFEAWVNGADQPRGLGAIAKVLSIDMRSGDSAWTKFKLDRLAKATDPHGFEAVVPGAGKRYFQGVVPYFAYLVNYRCEQRGAFASVGAGSSLMMDSLLWLKEPKTKGGGGIGWYFDIKNERAGDDCVLWVKEVQLADGSLRPCSVWLSGNEYPRALDGLCKLLSLDMAVRDVAWIVLKLTKLLNYAEPELDLFTFVPGNGKQAHYKSTVAYIAHLLMYRYKVLGLVNDEGEAIRGGLQSDLQIAHDATYKPYSGKLCKECNVHAVRKVDGCERCDSCGWLGSCG